ncbi:hypothetical protein BJY52DRAFT_520139 [Lactarius psammicola]|nr:hypothetical protein BJY52DRAFT_520139 [Lactarius psammicola]
MEILSSVHVPISPSFVFGLPIVFFFSFCFSYIFPTPSRVLFFSCDPYYRQYYFIHELVTKYKPKNNAMTFFKPFVFLDHFPFFFFQLGPAGTALTIPIFKIQNSMIIGISSVFLRRRREVCTLHSTVQ